MVFKEFDILEKNAELDLRNWEFSKSKMRINSVSAPRPPYLLRANRNISLAMSTVYEVQGGHQKIPPQYCFRAEKLTSHEP